VLFNNEVRLVNLRCISTSTLLPRHIREPRQVQLMRDGDRLRRTVAVFTEDQVRLAAPWIVPLEGIGPVQEDNHVSILFKAVVD